MTIRKPRRRSAEPTPEPPIVTIDDRRLLHDMQIEVICSQNIVVNNVWVPRDMIGLDGRTAILWRVAGDGNYAIDGWEPWHDRMFGGRYKCLCSALGWVQRARDIRAGKREYF